MNSRSVFFDTNILLYLFSAEAAKAQKAEKLLDKGGIISVQVLNEFVSVAQRKLRFSWSETEDALEGFRSLLEIVPLTIETHEAALHIAKKQKFSFYDSLIIATAQLAGAKLLYSEDMQPRKLGTLALRNPFA